MSVSDCSKAIAGGEGARPLLAACMLCLTNSTLGTPSRSDSSKSEKTRIQLCSEATKLKLHCMFAKH
jgi:hypothetical protein